MNLCLFCSTMVWEVPFQLKAARILRKWPWVMVACWNGWIQSLKTDLNRCYLVVQPPAWTILVKWGSIFPKYRKMLGLVEEIWRNVSHQHHPSSPCNIAFGFCVTFAWSTGGHDGRTLSPEGLSAGRWEDDANKAAVQPRFAELLCNQRELSWFLSFQKSTQNIHSVKSSNETFQHPALTIFLNS